MKGRIDRITKRSSHPVILPIMLFILRAGAKIGRKKANFVLIDSHTNYGS
jgi:hypothetical protein